MTTMLIGEGFEGPGVNAAHVNMMLGPKSGPAGQAFVSALASPSQGHAPLHADRQARRTGQADDGVQQ